MSIDDLWIYEQTIKNAPDYFEKLFNAAYTICGFNHKQTLYYLHKHNKETDKQGAENAVCKT